MKMDLIDNLPVELQSKVFVFSLPRISDKIECSGTTLQNQYDLMKEFAFKMRNIKKIKRSQVKLRQKLYLMRLSKNQRVK